MSDEIHRPTPDGPIESIAIRYKRDAAGYAHGIDPGWGRQIAAAAALIVQVRPPMPDGQPHPTPDATQAAPYCTTTPTVGDRLADACPDCGHATVLHIGVDHCPVCEMVDHNRRARITATRHVTINGVRGAPLEVAVRRLLERRELSRRALAP